jgi:DNA-binding PadR family transcriptional regulator
MTSRPYDILNTLEYYVLLALADRALYGYALKQAVAAESEGAVTPRAGSLYRVLARMMTRGFVQEIEGRNGDEPHPGLDRKYYALTPDGRDTLRSAAGRLRGAAALAEQRLGLSERMP